MSQTNVGYVYGTDSGLLRRIIVPDDDSELNNPSHSQPGETLVTIGKVSYAATTDHQALLNTMTGKIPLTNRCLVVNPGGTVTAVIVADSLIDKVPGSSLVNHPYADVGWQRISGNTFGTKVAVVTIATGIVQQVLLVDPTTVSVLPDQVLVVGSFTVGQNIYLSAAVI